jgi:hypothetical protein
LLYYGQFRGIFGTSNHGSSDDEGHPLEDHLETSSNNLILSDIDEMTDIENENEESEEDEMTAEAITRDIVKEREDQSVAKATDHHIRSQIIEKFWNDLYQELLPNEISQKMGRTQVREYQDGVIELLQANKKSSRNYKDMKALQTKIENFTMDFQDINIYQKYPNLISIFISKELPSAKDYLIKALPQEYLRMLNQFGAYTLEAIMIHVLGMLFNNTRDYCVVRVSTLIDQLSSAVRDQVRFLGVTMPNEEVASQSKSVNKSKSVVKKAGGAKRSSKKVVDSIGGNM